MPRLNALLETMLFVADPVASQRFYEGVLGLASFRVDERGCLLALPGGQVLGLVRQGVTDQPNPTPGGTVPPCGASGSMHLAFAISHSELGAWRSHLETHGVVVESEVGWQRGGRSLYFRDPDGHLVELATPGVWDLY